MSTFHELVGICSSYLKSNRVPIYTRPPNRLVSVLIGGVSCDGIQQSRQNR